MKAAAFVFTRLVAPLSSKISKLGVSCIISGNEINSLKSFSIKAEFSPNNLLFRVIKLVFDRARAFNDLSPLQKHLDGL